MSLVLTTKRIRWADMLGNRQPSAVIDGQKLYRVTSQSEEPEYLGTRQRTIEGQLRSTHGRKAWARRFSLECSVQHYDEARALAALLEHKAGSRVSLWLSAWPERQRTECDMAYSPLVLPIDNTGPLVWPTITLQAINQVTAFQLSWRSWNLLLNSGGELGDSTPEDWTAIGAPAWEQWLVHEGWRALSGTNGAYWHQTVPVEAGQRYTISALIAAATDATHNNLLTVEWLNGSGGVISSVSTGPQNLVSDFQLVHNFAKAPVGAVNARIKLTTNQTQPAIYDNVFFGPVGTEDTAPPPYQEGEQFTWTLAAGQTIAAGKMLQLGMRDRLASIDGAEASLADTAQWYGLPSGWQTLIVTATGSPSLNLKMMLTLDWTTMCEVLSLPEEAQAFGGPQGWERHGRRVSVELEEI